MRADGTALSTGIETLDRKLGGGIPFGTVVALSADPASQGERLLYELAGTRETVYRSTVRPAADVATALTDSGVDTDTIETGRIDPETPMEDAQETLADLTDQVTLVIDPVDVLEATDATRYRQFLADLKRSVTATANVAVLHCLHDDESPGRRRETVHVADLVLDLSTEVRGDSVVNRLTVPKFRTGQSVDDVIKLDLTSEVEVDTTRNIL